MVFGDAPRARFALNNDTIWTGGPRSYAREGAAQQLPTLRHMLLSGRQSEAEELAGRTFLSNPVRQMAYQPLGDLELIFEVSETSDYRRWLDLETAISMLVETDMALRSSTSAPQMAMMERTLIRLAMLPNRGGR